MMITITSMMLSLMFMTMQHPLSMGLIMILQTLNIAMITGLTLKSFWFPYILLITMLSGMLVLFIYMASIASNEKFKTPTKLIPMLLLLMLMMMYLYYTMDLMKMKKISSMMEMTGNEENILSMLKLFSVNMTTTILLICYLFLTMIAITFIVSKNEGPLRMKT